MKLRKIPLSLVVYWGLASVGLAMIAGIFGSTLHIFYQAHLGLGANWIGLAALIFALWNAVNDPLFGFITDNTRSRWGRRIPYLRFTAPFLAITFALLWMVPNGWGEIGIFAWMLVAMILYDTCFTIIGLVQSALLPELSEYEDDRVTLQVTQAFCNLLGFGLGFLIPSFLLPESGDASVVPLRLAMFAVGMTGAFLIILLSMTAKERPAIVEREEKITFKEYFAFTLKSKSGLIVIASNFMRLFVQSVIMAAVFFIADYLLKQHRMIVMLYFFVPMVLGILLASPIKKYLGVLKTQQVYYLFGAAGFISMFFVPPAWIPVSMAIAGFGMGGPEALIFVTLSQAIDEDELRTGRRREGAFFGTNALLTKPAVSLALWVPAQILECAGFIDHKRGGPIVEQPPEVLTAIRLYAGPICGIAFLLAAAILLLYPFKGNDLEEEMLRRHKD